MRTQLLSLLLRPTTPSTAMGLVVAASFIAGETALVYLLKEIAPLERMGPVYLLGVLVISAVWSLPLAMMTTIASIITFDIVRSWDTGHFVLTEAHNWMVHANFLVVALTANTLAALARARTAEANQRRQEAERARRIAEASSDKLAALAEQQAALRRIATLVAHGEAPSKVFSAVAEEMARCLHVGGAVLLRYRPDGQAVVAAAHGEAASTTIAVGACGLVDGADLAEKVSQRGHRGDAAGVTDVIDRVRAGSGESAADSGVEAPIVVGGRVWGAVAAPSSRSGVVPADIQARVCDFADLVSTAIANAAAREELTASRARIVTAADNARRSLERELHDGAQQRLESLKLEVRVAQESVPPELDELHEQMTQIVAGLTNVSEDLHEFSRGIHPTILASGLAAALRTLANRSAVPVDLDIAVPTRLPDPVELAAYYLVAEALTNAAKYADATRVHISAHCEETYLRLQIRDDGIGGADPFQGSGLIGLIDRVEALGGQLHIDSPPKRGTTLTAAIPTAINQPQVAPATAAEAYRSLPRLVAETPHDS
jgi:signal transduction histidine kinase